MLLRLSRTKLAFGGCVLGLGMPRIVLRWSGTGGKGSERREVAQLRQWKAMRGYA